jgi:hypothetical protein
MTEIGRLPLGSQGLSWIFPEKEENVYTAMVISLIRSIGDFFLFITRNNQDVPHY